MIQVLQTIAEVNEALKDSRSNGKTIGLVPTMGALHEGHLALIQKAKLNTDLVLVSVFVNPIQFHNEEDLLKYPNTWDEDIKVLQKERADFVFKPEIGELYPQKVALKLDFGRVETGMEGAMRPGHFNGVGIVVAKLLNIVKPHVSFFGQKDLQQVAVIRRLVEDLSFQTELYIVPTVREKDGLAMSSRNLRLGKEERSVAPLLFHCLNFAKDELLAGRDWFDVRDKVVARFAKEPMARLEYFEMVNSENMDAVQSLSSANKISVCVAAFIGEIRLIDNLPIID